MRGLLALGVLLGAAGCDVGSRSTDDEVLVVEAFLETGRALPPVILRRTTGLSAPDARDAASGGTVTVTLDGTPIPYEEQEAGRYVPTVDSTVRPQVPWTFEARWRDKTVQTRGRSPAPLSITEVCVDAPAEPVRAVQVDSLRRDSLDIPATVDRIYPMAVTVRWTSASDRPAARIDTSAWVRAKLRPDASSFPSRIVDFFLEPVTIRREDAFREENGNRAWSGVYAVPVDSAESDLLPPHDLTATLVRGDTAFASFARTRTDPDRREPISNVSGGLGIATAVAVDSLQIDAIAEPGTRQCRQP